MNRNGSINIEMEFRIHNWQIPWKKNFVIFQFDESYFDERRNSTIVELPMLYFHIKQRAISEPHIPNHDTLDIRTNFHHRLNPHQYHFKWQFVIWIMQMICDVYCVCTNLLNGARFWCCIIIFVISYGYGYRIRCGLLVVARSHIPTFYLINLSTN